MSSNLLISYSSIYIEMTKYDVAPSNFNLRHPRGFMSRTPRRGALLRCTKLTFFPNYFTFLVRAQVVSRILGHVEHREPACTPRRKYKPRPRFRGACSGPTNSGILAYNRGEPF